MKKRLLTITFALFVFSIPLLSVVNGQALSDVLKDLRSELKMVFEQRTQEQKQFQENYDREHKRMVDIITASNELSLLLYTQESDMTFDLAYALNKVTSAYKDFSKDRKPYDRFVQELNTEIDRYARLIEALRRLPPVMKEIEIEIVPDSLLYHNDSLDQRISDISSSLEKEVIRIAIKDSLSSPFVLDEEGEVHRDSCIRYASELLKMYADNRDVMVADSSHYQAAYWRMKEAYDYAQSRYRELEKYHTLKQSLYWQKNRLNRLKQRKAGLEYQIREKVYDMCYGSKEMFRRQHRLMENGYKTHEKWHNDFIRSRDRNIFYLGSSDESFGNQMCRLKYNSQTGFFTLELRKEYKYCTDKKACSKYIRLGGLDFKYMKDNLAEILESYDTAGNGSYPLSYRFHRTGNRWYLQAIFEQSFTDYRTVSKYGAVGLDYNDGFIELSETDSSGNLTGLKHFTLKNHGTGKKAEAEIRDVIAEITGYAEKRCKDIVIEDLDFKRKKACGTARSGKKSRKYNRMLHLFDYHRYKQTLQNTGFNHRVNIVIVNPKNTSKIGKQKYCGSRKLNIHQAAAYVIARRGQGYNDKLTA